MASSPDKPRDNKIASNRKAFHDFFVLDRIEAGLELLGTEVKSVRAGHVTLTGGFATLEGRQLFLRDVYIAPYECGNRYNHEPTRPRRLLLGRKEIDRLEAKIDQKGVTLVPLSMYFKNRWAKVELGVCKGKQDPDKRESLRRKDADRETRRAMSRSM
jgi:SsrA-binding protein